METTSSVSFGKLNIRHGESIPSVEEKSVVKLTTSGQAMGPLPRKHDAKSLGESRSQAVRRFLSLERGLHAKHQFSEVDAAVREYVELKHAEPVPSQDLNKPESEVYYLPFTSYARKPVLRRRCAQCSTCHQNQHQVCHLTRPSCWSYDPFSST